MDKIVIEGGKRIEGVVTISGAKNAVLPLMAACILTEGESSFLNVPDLVDVHTMGKLLRLFGARVEYDHGRLSVDTSRLENSVAPYELVKTMRASVLVLGSLIARFRRARVSLPGGCAIGERPIDQHLKGFSILGAEIQIEEGYIEAKAPRLRGATIPFDISTVTGTENIMLAAVMAKGETMLLNAACEPEVVELARVLNKMGAKIEGAGTDIITILGVDKLHPIQGHEVMPDRIEAGTFMVAAALTEGELTLKRSRFEHSGALTGKLIEAGAEVSRVDSGILVRGGKRVKSVDLKTLPYPGFPTDMQAQMMTLMSVAEGLSVITETIFPQRFMHLSELRRMGADIKLVGGNAVVRGVPYLSGAPVMASDLRASASLVLAGLVARGKTEVSRVYHLDRGYEKIEEKLEQVGAKIKRVEED